MRLRVLNQDWENKSTYGDVCNCLLSTAARRQFPDVYVSCGGTSICINYKRYWLGEVNSHLHRLYRHEVKFQPFEFELIPTQNNEIPEVIAPAPDVKFRAIPRKEEVPA